MNRISVVIPLYNKEKHIEKTISSVLSQTISDFEIIVVNDGSTDKSPNAVQNFKDPRIRLIHQKNAGVSAARNKGIYEANADLIAFLDADDEWTPDFLKTILRLYEKYPQAGLYATFYFLSNNKTLATPYIKGIHSSPWEGLITNYFYNVSNTNLPFSASSVAVPKCVFYDVGFFSVGMARGEDQDMWARIAIKYPIAYSTNKESIYHLDATNRACNKKIILKEIPFQETPFIKIAKTKIYAGEIPADEIEPIEKYISNIKFHYGITSLRYGYYKIAKEIFMQIEPKYLMHNLFCVFGFFLRKICYLIKSLFNKFKLFTKSSKADPSSKNM